MTNVETLRTTASDSYNEALLLVRDADRPAPRTPLPVMEDETEDFASFEEHASSRNVSLKPFIVKSLPSATLPKKVAPAVELTPSLPNSERTSPAPTTPAVLPIEPQAPKSSSLTGSSKPVAKSIKFSPSKTKRSSRVASNGIPMGFYRADMDASISNRDYCEACRGRGHFLCCDLCPRSFHFQCLEPPLGVDDVPTEEWYCRACASQQAPPNRNFKSSIFSQLLLKTESDIPKTFKLPLSLRTEYKDVATADNGDFYRPSILKPPRVNKAGFVELPDPFAVKDHKNRLRFCHHCKLLASQTHGKSMVSCDLCDLHFHLDCLDPPAISLPPNSKKWRCPLHAEHDQPVVRKTKPQVTVYVGDRNEPNNGNINIVPRKPVQKLAMPRYDEILYRNIRYQVPEETLILDFWAKVRGGKGVHHKRAESKNRLAKQLGLQGGDESDSSLSSLDSVDFPAMKEEPPLPSTSTNPPQASTSAKFHKSSLKLAKRPSSRSPSILSDTEDRPPASALVNGTTLSRPLSGSQSAILPSRKTSLRHSKRLRSNPDGEEPLLALESPLKVRLALPPSRKRKAKVKDTAAAPSPQPGLLVVTPSHLKPPSETTSDYGGAPSPGSSMQMSEVGLPDVEMQPPSCHIDQSAETILAPRDSSTPVLEEDTFVHANGTNDSKLASSVVEPVSETANLHESMATDYKPPSPAA